jgi:DNA-binding HxlR family transcriptional regulator
MMENEDEFDPITFSILKDTFALLEQEGMLEVVGISEDGEDIYQITEKGLDYYMTQQMDFESWAKIGIRSRLVFTASLFIRTTVYR